MAELRYELYLLTFSSGRQYIGISKNGAEYRYKKHRSDALNGGSVLCHKAWRKYGDPELKVLAVTDDECIFELEKKAIKAFKTMFPHGYNMMEGGELSPASSRFVALKISASKKGKPIHPNTLAACIAKNTGLKHSKETREKLSEIRRGKPCSEETRRKISEAQKGKPRPHKGVLKMAAALRGKKQSQETIEKRKTSRLNIKNPPESYAKGWETRRNNSNKAKETLCL